MTINRLSLSLLAGLVLAIPHAAAGQQIEQDTLEGPVFTPFTVRPELDDAREARRILNRHYPPDLREAGVGGHVMRVV